MTKYMPIPMVFCYLTAILGWRKHPSFIITLNRVAYWEVTVTRFREVQICVLICKSLTFNEENVLYHSIAAIRNASSGDVTRLYFGQCCVQYSLVIHVHHTAHLSAKVLLNISFILMYYGEENFFCSFLISILSQQD